MKKKENQGESGQVPLSCIIEKITNKGLKYTLFILITIAVVYIMKGTYYDIRNADIQNDLMQLKEERDDWKESDSGASMVSENDFSTAGGEQYRETGFPMAGVALNLDCDLRIMPILQRYQELRRVNTDFIGWLSIDGTKIDYPVMQTMWNENYYLDKDFYGQANKNGCLIMDTDSVVGKGTLFYGYLKKPSTNLIIHGHTMKSGEMFGDLELYAEESYGKKHCRIQFDSLYESREYELISVFYSQVFYEDEEVFKYYKFFQADTKEEFQYWYENIRKLSLYDTGIVAEWGDEFITLSCCAYHVEDGRFVVVGKRIK